MTMSCIHSNSGCTWTGDLSNLNVHLETCRYDLIDCPAKCGHKVGHVCLSEHLRVKCRYEYCEHCVHCGNMYTVGPERLHASICLKIPLPCPNKCEIGRINREDMVRHLNEECESNIVSCTYKEMGCDYEGLKYELEQHLNQNLELHMEKMCIKMVSLRTIVNQQSTEIMTQQQEIEEQRNANCEQANEIKQLKDELKVIRDLYEMTDKIWIIDDFSNKMVKAKNKTEVTLASPPFYTHQNGYKMRGKLYLNGEGAGESTHMSVFYQLMKGDYDDLLQWPFPHKMKFTLMDWNPNTSEAVHNEIIATLNPPEYAVKKPTMEYNSGYGLRMFISHENLYAGNYIKNDKIIIKMKVIK